MLPCLGGYIVEADALSNIENEAGRTAFVGAREGATLQ